MANRELNDVKINVEFQEAANRQQLSSGDEIKTLFGKIKKWFTDLKAVAFTGSYNDLTDQPSPYTHPTTSGNKHIPSGGSSGQILRWSSDGTAMWGSDNNTTYGVATTNANGLMSSTDKFRFDNLKPGTNITEMSGCSGTSGTSTKYARSDHTHHRFAYTVAKDIYGSGYCYDPDADSTTYQWYTSEVLTFYTPSSSNYKYNRIIFDLHFLIDDDYNNYYHIEGSVDYNGCCKFSRIDNSGITDPVFKIGYRTETGTNGITTHVYISMELCGIHMGVLVGTVYSYDLPEQMVDVIEVGADGNTITDTTTLNKISWAVPHHYGNTFSEDLRAYKLYTEMGIFTEGSTNPSIGTSSNRFSNLYLKTAPNVSSDKNMKKNIQPLRDIFLEFFYKLKPVSFKLIDGTSGRTHLGFISQDVEEAMKEVGLTDLDFAGFCKDKIVNVVRDKNGNIQEEPVLGEDGNPVYVYSLRYEEFIVLNTMVIQKLYAKNLDLEQRLNRIEQLLDK